MKRRNVVLLAIAVLTAMSMLSTGSYIHAGKNPKKGKTEMASLEGMQMDAENSGYCGDSVRWDFNPSSGELVISGNGAMSNYTFPGVPTPWDRLGVTSLKIEEGVTEIGTYAFYYCVNLANISFPNSLNRIGAFSFTGCNELTNIEIPSQVRTIEHSAFCYCRQIDSLTIHSDSINIAAFAFGFCENLKASAYTYIAEGRHISHCAFYKEFNDDSAAKKEEEHDEKIDSLQIPTDSTKLKLFEKLEIVTPTL